MKLSKEEIKAIIPHRDPMLLVDTVEEMEAGDHIAVSYTHLDVYKRQVQEGAKKKFVNQVEHITFSGKYAVQVKQPVLYSTERAVFELRPEGVTLIEIAPGIDLQTQVLDQMEFMPKIAEDLKLMDERIFKDELMGLAED